MPRPPRRLALATLAAMLAAILPAAADTSAPGPSAPAVPVQTATAQRQDVPVMLRNIGAVQAFYSVLIRARVDGTLDRVLFTEGQDVKAGQPLAEIDPRPYAAVLDAAEAKKAADEAQLANARADLARYQSLVRNDFASRQQVQTQTALVARFEATVAGDQAAVESARLNLEFCHIVSPIDGRAGLRLVDPGNLIHANDAQGIVTIAQIHPIAVVFTLPQDNLPQIQAAMARGAAPVLAYSADDRTQLARGTLLTIDNQVDQSTGTIRLKAEFKNPENRLWPGQFVNAHLQVDTLHDAVTIPTTAVQRGPNGLYAYVIGADSKAAMRPIKLTLEDGDVAVVAEGVEAGARVVVKGQLRLQDGTRVSVAAKPNS